MKLSPFATSALLALILGLGLATRLFFQQRGFSRIVDESLATSEGYDKNFIDMVNHLEDVLTARASFPFMGGKDPMTGRRREVAAVAAPVAVAPRKPAPAKAAPGRPEPARRDTAAAAPEDRVKLTAIIADDYGQHTAIVMDGERSLSVDVGDSVGPRKVTRVTAREIVMEDDKAVYTYGIAGNRSLQRK